ncbi:MULTISPECIES: DUF397 domain-containing protein [Streptomyces]|uniref:DUF397 domain-containing protein n=2 Tax=Streptomyces rimosus subsp. rimosus TaxID=132474 RepID=L8F0G2_STRR1|nr:MULTISPECIES: DUF397 domain-containing protein [Streptomyces]MYT48187.1 DUF397 domain-containing protein [Streptomyces sp. SID5471]KEF21083.1 hypothetical protein DF18_07710 [Streptomyces rimosus]KUJ33246.1 toxin-antitoxin system, toxin component [Streptomyces rimosus subsp. rimosus]QDA05734.1 DUF397 domain-containing protein [Streptomyces rimosus]QEV77010.1 DUF397 domain-containing protein [Streptomyces rimosus]
MPEPQWLKSSFSEASGNNCVEIASTGSHVSLRESEDLRRVITTGPKAFRSLLVGIKADIVGIR